MLKRTFLTLLWASMLATAAVPLFPLGVDYSQWLVASPLAIATDASGAIYVLNAADRPFAYRQSHYYDAVFGD